MADYLEKLRPDRDLQCYFERPSAIAALNETSATGFTVSGCWRQQFDWAVLEWNRDNVFEHAALRNLPDGDLSGLQLSYEEVRSNCIAMDSNWFPTVDWPWLRVWATGADGVERLYKVPLKNHATPVQDAYGAASATFQLTGTLTPGDYVELAWLNQHCTALVYPYHTKDVLIAEMAASINNAHAGDPAANPMTAAADADRITLYWTPDAGANGNRVGVYGNVNGAHTEEWSPWWQRMSGGTSPSKWRVELNFASLEGYVGPEFTTVATIPTANIRKLRWTWAAEMQTGNFARSEFSVVVSNWAVSGTGRRYKVAGAASRRVEDNSSLVAYSGLWTEARGNYSGGSIRYAQAAGASVTLQYEHERDHTLYLGTRRGINCGQVSIAVDGVVAGTETLTLDEDLLVRVRVADLAGQVPHTVTVTSSGGSFWFDFFEMAVPVEDLPVFSPDAQMTLATDWDTDHSLALAPERTAWLIRSLGFAGRANHYVGALWFYELVRDGHEYGSATITFSGVPEFGKYTDLTLGSTTLSHLNLIGDTAESVAKAFELEINAGSSAVWATAGGTILTLRARQMGTAGNGLTLAANTYSETFTAAVSGATAGGMDGVWHTDLASEPRLNRAARDWSRSFFRALQQHGIPVTAAFSMELQHGDDSAATGIAQRYPSGNAAWLNTPALQTNFSPASTNFWKQVYLDAALLMQDAGQAPYLQFGEVQWWYFPDDGSGMPFYDAYTCARFQSEKGRLLPVFVDGNADPALYPEECSFLAGLIGEFTAAVMAYVRQTVPGAQFEVLYPPDVNDAPLNQVVNLPGGWSPGTLEGFKTENFTYTFARDLNKAGASVRLPMERGFARSQSAHLVGVGEYTTPWEKEALLAKGEGVGSVVLFALDQYCLLGHGKPGTRTGRSLYLG